MMNPPQQTRREFLRDAGTITAAVSLVGCLHHQSAPAVVRKGAGEKLNLGIIGAGGRGAENLREIPNENIVALCDVDDKSAAKTFAKYPGAKRYRDFRKMLEMEKTLDAVVVSTPDHTHAIAAITALEHGRHVYCEKPLGHSIYEVRRMREVAERTGLVTQMGQQGHAMEGSRQAVEVIRSGILGIVRELHVWTDRPAGWWPQGEERPTDTPPVPDHLDWDLWLGPAASRPYHPVYLPFKWRGRWDFGTGAIGDMAVHNLDTAFWGLDLGVPSTAELVASDRQTSDCPPLWSILRLEFPARKNRGPVWLKFYDGAKHPPAELFHGEEIPSNGSLVVGSKGTLFTRTWHGGGETAGDMFMLLPRREFVGYVPPTPSLPRTKEHHYEFLQACKGGPRTESSFSYAAVLTEALLVGQLALRTGRKIEWDKARMRAQGVPEADPFIRPTFRTGWTI